MIDRHLQNRRFQFARLPLVAALALSSQVYAQSDGTRQLLGLSLEQLLDVEVSSITGRSQKITESAAAIYVMTAEDIANSSALTVPDLLRIIPGLEVAQIDSNKWAISARGFNSRIASKVLVIIDGRNVYSPTFATVFWETEDLLIEDIERIEVIRGPGATIWGANAVNGVISITTKSTRVTEGNRATLSAGNVGHNVASLQHGATAGLDTSYRVYAKFREHDEFNTPQGLSVGDEFKTNRFGFRVDSQLTPTHGVTLQGDVYNQDIRQNLNPIIGFDTFRPAGPDQRTQNGRNILARWQHDVNETSVLSTQFYYDKKTLKDATTDEISDTYDLDIKLTSSMFENHNITLGAGVRNNKHQYKNGDYLRLTPITETLKLYNVSAHDDIHLNEKTILGLSLKLENNIYTGTEYQPNISLNYAISPSQHIWSAWTRSVRTPSRAERSIEFIAALLPAGSMPDLFFDTYIKVEPEGPGMGIEKLNSFEAGWRYQSVNGYSVDLALYYNKYDELRSVHLGEAYCVPDAICFPNIQYVIQTIKLSNLDSASTVGFEALLTYEVSDSISVETSFSHFDIDYTNTSPMLISGPNSLSPDRTGAIYKFVIQTNWRINDRSNLDVGYRHVSDPGLPNFKGYDVFDVRYRWNMTDNTSLMIGGRNLFDDHQEFKEDLLSSPNAEIEGMYYLKIDWRW